VNTGSWGLNTLHVYQIDLESSVGCRRQLAPASVAKDQPNPKRRFAVSSRPYWQIRRDANSSGCVQKLCKSQSYWRLESWYRGRRVEAIIFIGIQGSGKSTFYRERFFDTHVRISLDLLKTRGREREFVSMCLRTGQKFVVDNTNVRIEQRREYIAMARAAGFRVIGYFFDTPLRTALARNGARSGGAVIPVPGVIGTHKRLARPAMEEGFDELHVITPEAPAQ
jgi:predicted kinase